jgi:hypothetical protein
MSRARNATRNTTDAEISVPKVRTKTTETKRTRTNVIIDKPPGMDVNAVLRDITDQYLASPAPQKKAKRKLNRTTAATVPKPKRIESSLPPSSPPSTSSQMPADTSYNFPEINALPSDPIDADPNVADDPFGFFAVEAKLKASRRPRAPTVPRALQCASSDSVDGNTDESLQQAFATPKPRNPLRTPRKRTDAKKRKLEPSTSSHSFSAGGADREEESESMLSTPSPVKAGDRSVEVDDDEDLKDVAKAKRKGGDRKKVKSTRAEADMNPVEIARNLEALLPRRPKLEAVVRRAGRGRGTKVPAKFDDSDDEGNKKQKSQKDYKRRAQLSVKGKGKRETEGSDGDEEKMRRRQARIDYFKKLDGYEVQKEDVYIV